MIRLRSRLASSTQLFLRRPASLFAIACIGLAATGFIRITTAQNVRAKLLIWPKVGGSMSGGTMNVEIDGKGAGSIGNLKTQELMDIGDLAVGLHQFNLTAITGYAIDQAGNAQKATAGDGKCNGQFIVQPFQIYYVVMVGTQNGTDFQCRIQ